MNKWGGEPMMKQVGFTVCVLVLVLVIGVAHADSGDATPGDGENASNPLAAVNNTDLRLQYFDLGGSDRISYYINGAYMLNPKLKLTYDLYYWDTDVTGSSESGFESFRLKGIYFPRQGRWGTWNFKTAVGLEWILSSENEDKGIGSGADQIAPFAGVAYSKGATVLIPLVQHFAEYSGPPVSTTAFRVIAIQSFQKQVWGKLDFKLPFDWENDTIPSTAEVQLGKMFTPKFGTYVDTLFGIGSDRPYDWGIGIGVRFRY